MTIRRLGMSIIITVSSGTLTLLLCLFSAKPSSSAPLGGQQSFALWPRDSHGNSLLPNSLLLQLKLNLSCECIRYPSKLIVY